MGSVPGSGLVEVLTEGDIADPVEPVLDVPVVADPGGQFGRCGLLCGQCADGVDGLGAPPEVLTCAPLGVDRSALADDLDGLGGVWEAESGGHGDGFQGAFLDPPVAAGAAGVAGRDVLPRQRFEPVVLALLIALSQLQVVAFNLFDGHHILAVIVATLAITLAGVGLHYPVKKTDWARLGLAQHLVFAAGLGLTSYVAWIHWVSLLGHWWDQQLYLLPGHLGGDYSLFVLLFATPWLLLGSDRTTKRLALNSLVLLVAALVAWLLSL